MTNNLQCSKLSKLIDIVPGDLFHVRHLFEIHLRHDSGTRRKRIDVGENDPHHDGPKWTHDGCENLAASLLPAIDSELPV